MAQDFISTLMEMGRGEVVNELRREFDELCTQVLETKGAGAMTLTIQVKPKAFHRDTGRVTELELGHKLTIKEPRFTSGPSTFFVTEDGDLTRNNPDQLQLDMNQAAGQRRQ